MKQHGVRVEPDVLMAGRHETRCKHNERVVAVLTGARSAGNA